ncbi:Na/Pi cotransporter family protein [Wenxinia marina]|uniref:Na+/phosphate symporter n=1 Tax=Wenxinia marina DSM 24838 TaxID=1123501 RepID=A0A0D0PG04_9RHOB|nr:Na/Pi cotransporter family protein [Wenxinia marina]KIQ70246.1 Na+/phosphate symporter [Wenxinia marina DSM 24838]GGL50037.1 sodium:phosphate symporter [Wenxinia marina]
MDATIGLINLLGAGALILWGLRMIKSGILSGFGASLRQLIAKWTGNRVVATLTGLVTTLAVQSSTATAVIAGSFVARNLVGPRMAQAVLLGANLGTAITAAVLAHDLHWLAPMLVLAGVITDGRSRMARGKGVGKALIGLGLMLFGLELLGGATEPLRESQVMTAILAALADGPVFGLILSAGLAFLSSSSLAVVLFVSMLAATGSVSPALALVLVAGANLGGAIPPCLAVAAEGIAAKRLTRTNLAVRAAGALAVLVTAGTLGPEFAALLPPGTRFAIAAHLAFNLVLLAVFMPLLGPLDRLAQRVWPDPEAASRRVSYLDKSAFDTPSLALAGAARETLRIGDTVAAMMERNLKALQVDDPGAREATSDLDDQVDAMLSDVKLYLARLARGELNDADTRRANEIMSYAINLEHVGDILDRDLAEMAEKKMARQVRFSVQGEEEIAELYRKTILNLELAQSVFLSHDVALARRLMAEKVHVRRIEEASQRQHLARLQAGRPETLASTTLHLDILRDLKRVNAHIASVAYPILAEAGELTESRVVSIRKAETAQTG